MIQILPIGIPALNQLWRARTNHHVTRWMLLRQMVWEPPARGFGIGLARQWAFMALCRIKRVERLRGNPPGEFGKLLGLNRIPEVRCLREKMDALSVGNSAEIWAAHLSKRWMEAAPEVAGTLYVDGHVRAYLGNLTKLPRRYVTRQRLCLRGTTDYWVNDFIGQPFFLVEKAIDVHLILMVPPKVSISQLLGWLKGQASMRLFQQFRYLKKKPYWGNHLWAKGYCVDTVGLDADMIRKYVRYQEKKEQQLEQLQLFD